LRYWQMPTAVRGRRRRTRWTWPPFC